MNVSLCPYLLICCCSHVYLITYVDLDEVACWTYHYNHIRYRRNSQIFFFCFFFSSNFSLCCTLLSVLLYSNTFLTSQENSTGPKGIFPLSPTWKFLHIWMPASENWNEWYWLIFCIFEADRIMAELSYSITPTEAFLSQIYIVFL